MTTWSLPVCHDCEQVVGRPTEDESKAKMAVRSHDRPNDTAPHDTEIDTFEAGNFGANFPGKRPNYPDQFETDGDQDGEEATA